MLLRSFLPLQVRKPRAGIKHALLVMLACLVLLPGNAALLLAGGPKLTVDEVIAKHLDSLAPAAVRAAAKTRAIEGTASFVIKTGGQGYNDQGKCVLISEGWNFALGLRFPANDYPGERIVVNGAKFDVAKLNVSGERSPLGGLLNQDSEILHEGLFGGALSTSWALLEAREREAKLKYDGLKKVDGVELHRIAYVPKKANNGLEVFLFFDPQTFRHVKTLYRLEIQPGAPEGPTGIGSSHTGHLYTPNTRYKLEEDFSDFKTQDGWTLPTHWKIRYTWDPTSGQGTTVMDYEIVLQHIINNGAVDPKTFAIE